MPPRRTRNINDVYERIMARMDERLDQFVDQFSNRMNDMMNLRRCGDRNGDDYEGAPVFDDGYEEAPIFDDDQFEEESMPVYDTDIEDVISEEEENMEDIVVVANDLCSSMIQTTLSVDFSKNINSNPLELIWYHIYLFKYKGVAVGCGWQAYVAYVNIGCYYVVGIPLGFLLGFYFDLGVKTGIKRDFPSGLSSCAGSSPLSPEVYHALRMMVLISMTPWFMMIALDTYDPLGNGLTMHDMEELNIWTLEHHQMIKKGATSRVREWWSITCIASCRRRDLNSTIDADLNNFIGDVFEWIRLPSALLKN
ncbi:hypothetical protein Tco_1326852 [Tanacetum coccineum]